MSLLQRSAHLAGRLERTPGKPRCRTDVEQPAGHRAHLIDQTGSAGGRISVVASAAGFFVFRLGTEAFRFSAGEGGLVMIHPFLGVTTGGPRGDPIRLNSLLRPWSKDAVS
jgi:hypothetical protein